MTLARLARPIRRWLYAGGTRKDRLRDPDAVIAVVDVRPGMVVGDLGPGAGHFTLRLARAVEPNGVVYALDASRSTLDDLCRAADDRGIRTLRAVPVRRDRLEIPEPVDLLFVSATYHHLPEPARYFAEARAHLRPGARVAILESRREGLLARWHGRHASSPRRVLREMTDAGYRLTETHDVVNGYWFGLFEVPERPGGLTGPEPGVLAPVLHGYDGLVTDQAAPVATASKSLFRQECAVTAEIAATPERIWQLLTDVDGMVRWNSTLTSMAGTIGPGGKVSMEVPEAPGTVFKIEVTRFEPPHEMVWTQGNPIMFRGARTYRLTPLSADITRFEMIEVFSGLVLPMAAGRLPDFKPIFERYAADLKAEAETSSPQR